MGDNRISDGMICAFGDGKDTCQVVKIDYDDFDSNTTMTMSITIAMTMTMTLMTRIIMTNNDDLIPHLRATAEDR